MLFERKKTEETSVFEQLAPESMTSKGAFHLSELPGQDISFVMRILLLIKAIQPDQSNPKQYA